MNDNQRHGHGDKKKSKKKSKEVKLIEDSNIPQLIESGDEAAVMALSEEEKRRLKKHLRRAEKRAERLREMGLDMNGEPFDNYCIAKYPVREWKFKLPGSQDLVAINPVVFCLSVICLWSLTLWSSVDANHASATLQAMRGTVSLNFAWFFHGSKAITFFFLMYTTYKYGHIHLGRRNDKPEFSNLSYFAMIFSAGVGSAMLVFGVLEPLSHQESNYFTLAGYRSQDEIDMFGINLAVSNWSILTWTYNATIAVCLSLATHRFQLPMTYRSCYYPIFGTYTWGWIGDFIDGLTAVVTIVGACIALGITATQVITASTYIGWIDEKATPAEIMRMQNVVIWIVTILSSVSVISGMRGAVQLISLIAFLTGCLLTFLLFAMDDTKYLLNLQVQEVGYFFQNSIFQLNFWTDSFGQLREGSGRAVDGKASEEWWMDAWLTFYAAWQVTIAAGIGMFVAGISRGRKVWEVVMYCFAVPSSYSLISFCIWGGIGLRQSRQAKELAALGTTYFNNSGHFLADGSDLCYDVPQRDVIIDNDVIFTNYLPGVTPVCEFSPQQASLNVLSSFSFTETFGETGLGPMLAFLYLVGIALFFVASSDAATLVVDSLASNGRKNYHWARRMFWASTVGALTTSLASGGADSLIAIQSASYVLGLPLAILMCFLIQSISLMCQAASRIAQDGDYEFSDQPEFGMPVYGGVFNVLEYAVSIGKVHPARAELGMHHATRGQVEEFAKGIVIPFVSLNQILSATYPANPKRNLAVVLCYTVCYVGWIALFLSSLVFPGLSGLAFTVFLVTGLILSMIRAGFRSLHQLRSNPVADVISCVLFWPQAFAQMRTYSVSSFKSSEKKSKEVCGTTDAIRCDDSSESKSHC